jgi:hypothetical protein
VNDGNVNAVVYFTGRCLDVLPGNAGGFQVDIGFLHLPNAEDDVAFGV